jgi:aminoglycoside phosphotransferase (APT) family kinase protein
MIETITQIIRKELSEEPIKITRMKTGLCNEVYLAELPSKKVIIRLNKNPKEMSGSAKNLALFKSLGIKVQEIIAEDYSLSDSPFAYQIRSYIEGKDINHVIEDLSEEELRGIAQNIAEIVKKLKPQTTNGKYGWAGGSDHLFDSWAQLIEAQIQDIVDRNEKTGAVGDNYIQIAKDLLEQYRAYFEAVPSTFYYDDMSSKNVLIHEGKFAGLVDLDTVAYGDPLEGIGRIKASWYGTPYGKIYSEAVIDALELTEKEREMVHVYGMLNRISWLSESGIQFNQNTSSEINWEHVEKDKTVVKTMIEALDGNS